MAGCCTPAGQLAGGSTDAPAAGRSAVRAASTTLTWRDHLGAWRVRWNIGRMRYAVDPGLYTVGEPDADAPVLVTANYKLTFDVVRRALAGRSAWLLVLDTRGINVWCAAGKGTFGTVELSKRVIETGLAEKVSHRTLVVPQLGATGVAAHDVREFTGFRVVWGPVRVEDVPAYLDAGMKTTDEMRRVTFTTRERLVLVPTELSSAWRPRVLLGVAAAVALSGVGSWGFSADQLVTRGAALLAALIAGLLAGAFVVPVALPWLPGRMFATKGALVGAVAGAVVAGLALPSVGTVAALGLLAASTGVAAFLAMNFTGATTFTSPTGVEHEMRRTLPWQVGLGAVAVVAWVVSAILGGV